MESNLVKTALYDVHVEAGAKLVPFAGYSMPIQYATGIRAEHEAVRNAVGMFDVSHMGEFWVRGGGAEEFVQYVAVNDASSVEVGQAQYSALCNEEGRVLDDLLVYRFEDRVLLVVNASNRQKDWDWLNAHAERFDVELSDDSDTTALIALQGPRSQEVLASLTASNLDGIGYYRFVEGEVAGHASVISRTGYTGEDGFELYLPATSAEPVWRALVDAGQPMGLIPAGLGARDSLRLEMGYALYGNDLDEAHTALESGLGWIVKLGVPEFLGREALAEQKEKGVDIRLVGIRLTERGFPRPGYAVVKDDADIGTVTSGVSSPSLGEGVAMGYVPTAFAKAGTEVGIRIRNDVVPGVVQRPPFYTEGSIRR